MKKGASHVDWVISMTIFILGVLTLMIFLIPLVNKPLYPKEVLLPIVEDNFRNGYYWNIKKIPLFVENIKPGCRSVTATFHGGWLLPDGSNNVMEENLSPNTKYEYFLHNEEINKKLFATLTSEGPCLGDYEIYIGAEQNFFGISNELLNNLKTKNYEDLKREWSYPFSNDFAIYIDNQLIIGSNQPNSLNIFVNQFRDFIINKEGNLQPVVVSLRAW